MHSILGTEIPALARLAPVCQSIVTRKVPMDRTARERDLRATACVTRLRAAVRSIETTGTRPTENAAH
jgi:hypothetical protein